MADERARNLYRQSGDRRQRSGSCVAEHADRSVTRAAVILLALGLWSSVEGLTVVAHADLGTGMHYLAGSLDTRGWIAIGAGTVAIYVGMRARRDDRRWRSAAVTTLAISAIAQLVMIPNYPGWLLCIFTLNCLTACGLIASAGSPGAKDLRLASFATATRCAPPPSVKQQHNPTRGAFRSDGRRGEDTPGRQTLEWRQWRRCAQGVTRSWNEWLAADRLRSAECYRRYVAALDQEERAAAAFERVFIVPTANRRK
jgi:hypothetical protein